MAAYCPKHGKDGLFKELGSEENGVTEVESVCMYCHENGMTKLMLTLIPHFREVVISSFHCEHCGFEDRSIQSGGRIHDKGVTFELTVKDDKDLNRQVVKSEWATLRIPEVDFEQPSRKRGEVNTVEGVLNVIINGLSTLQPARREQQPETAEKIDEFIAKLTRLKFLDEPFTLIIEDPSGSSYVENPYMPEKDPNMVVTHSLRTPEDNEILGLQNEDLVNGDAELEKEEEKEEEENEKVTEEDNLLKEVLGFKTNCPDCNVPCETNMKVVDIPFFKQSIIMATVCEACGYRENEVRSGSGIEPKGREITLKLTDPTDLSRDVLKSDTCGVRIPELEFELLEGTLGGRFTTIEGLLTNVKDQLSSKNPFIMGDSALTTTAQRIDKFCGKLQEIIDGKLLDIHIILDDPAGNSYIQNLYAPDPDPEMKTREYERSFEQNEELGLNDMKTDNYTNEPEPDS